jgi:carbon monoxide dehydrogenase subunit G
MTRLHREIDTRLDTAAAFAFVADFANAQHWDPGVATSETIGSAPTGLGSRYVLGVRLGGRVAPMEYRITAFDAPNRVVLSGEGSNVTAVDDIRFAPSASGSGTHIDYTADIALGGLMRLAQPFLGRAFDKLARNAVEGMQRTLDQLAAAGEPAAGEPAAGEPAAGEQTAAGDQVGDGA